MQVENLTFDFGETQDFDGELKILKICMQKQVIVILNTFFRLCLVFNLAKFVLTFMLDPWYKGLRLVINYVGKEHAFQIEGEYDK
jgi:hypothetical protein